MSDLDDVETLDSAHPEVAVALRPIPILLVLSLSGLLAAGCSATESSGSTASGGKVAADAAAPAAERVAAADGSAFSGSADSAKSNGGADPAEAALPTRKVRTAQITVEVQQLAAAVRQVHLAADTHGGQVTAEKSTFATAGSPSDGPNYAESVLTVRVPEPQLDAALTQVAATGKPLDRSTTSDDVTAQIADLDSRVRNQEASVARIRNLMAKATSLKDVVLIEGQLTSRESDLEALQARQRVLNNQADLATMTVDLRTPSVVAKAKPAKQGFLAGLSNGWHGAKRTTVVVLTVVGAILPFAVILSVLSAIGYLGYTRGYRRLRPATTSFTPAGGPAPATDPAAPPT